MIRSYRGRRDGAIYNNNKATRMERKRKRQWVIVYLVLSAAILALAVAIIRIDPWQKKEIQRVPYNPPYEVFADSATNATIYYQTLNPTEYDVPLDRYTKRVLRSACDEWDVPYELALAVCWRETQYEDRITTVVQEDGVVRHYYGMMAVQFESAGSYMEKCGIEYLNSEEDKLRVGCCILGGYLQKYDTVSALMCYNAGEDGAEAQWEDGVYETDYTRDVLWYIENELRNSNT